MKNLGSNLRESRVCCEVEVFSKIPAHNKMIDDPLIILDNANSTKESVVRDHCIVSMRTVGHKGQNKCLRPCWRAWKQLQCGIHHAQALR